MDGVVDGNSGLLDDHSEGRIRVCHGSWRILELLALTLHSRWKLNVSPFRGYKEGQNNRIFDAPTSTQQGPERGPFFVPKIRKESS